MPHLFCALYVVTYYDVSRGGIRDKSGTYPIFSGQLATMNKYKVLGQSMDIKLQTIHKNSHLKVYMP